MHQIDLSRVDLNLLVVFEALLQERHVGRAAQRLCLSQSATSHALGRLRKLLDDPLFVRNPRGIEPTPHARSLAEPIARALEQIRQVLTPSGEFDPAKLRRTFTVATHDYAMMVALSPVLAEIQTRAPGVDIRCVNVDARQVLDGLDRGELDFALGGFPGVRADRVRRTDLFSDRFVGLARRGHPALKGRAMSLGDFTQYPHVLTSPPGGESRGQVDDVLEAQGLRRRVAVTAPNFLPIPFLIERGELIGVLPARLATRMAQSAPLTIFDLPISLDPIICSMLAPEPLSDRPDMRWMLGLLLSAVSRSQVGLASVE